MKSSPGFLWGGINLYTVGLDRPMDTSNRSRNFKDTVKTLEKHFDAVHVKIGDDLRVPLKKKKVQ